MLMVALIQAIFQPLWDLISQIVEKFGTKFAIAITAIGGLLYLSLQPSIAPPPFSYILPIACVVGIVLVAGGYFYYRREQEKEVVAAKKEVALKQSESQEKPS